MVVYEIPQDSKKWIKNQLSKKYSSDEAEAKYQEILEIYEKFSNETPSIGGKDNPMSKNFYGALSAFAYYECMNCDMSPDEIMDMCFGMMIGDKKGGQLSKFNLNNKLVQKIFHGLFRLRAKKLNRHKKDGSWNNTWGMEVQHDINDGIHFVLRGCPIKDYCEKHGIMEILPYLCNMDHLMIQALQLYLIRPKTCSNGDEICEYTIVANDSPLAKINPIVVTDSGLMLTKKEKNHAISGIRE